MRLNFDANKTAAMCVFKGPHSQEARRRYLLDDAPSIAVDLRNSTKACVRLVESYKHLGGIMTHDGSCMTDIASRRSAAQSVLARLMKTLFKNKALTGQDKRELLNSLVIRKFLFGAGHWVFRSKREASSMRSAIMHFYRNSCWAIAGCSSKLLRDVEICNALGVLGPDDLLCCERVRLLIEIVRHGHGFLWELQVCERACLKEALNALRHVLEVVGRDWQLPQEAGECLTALQCRVEQGAALLRAFARKVIQDGREEGRRAQRLADKIKVHERDGCVVVARPHVGVEGLWCCRPCGQTFSSKAAFCAHRSIKHQKPALRARVAGTLCHSCAREFWSTARLRAHIQAVELCARRYRHADLNLPESFEIQGSEKRAAWQPVVSVNTVRPPFWASQTPTQSQEDYVAEHEDELGLRGQGEDTGDCLEILLRGNAPPDEAWLSAMLQWAVNNEEGFLTKLHTCKATIAKLCLDMAADGFQPQSGWYRRGDWAMQGHERFVLLRSVS